MESFVARQPVFNRDRTVFGYELLFRAGPENAFGNVDGDFATASLICDSLHLHGIESLTSGRKCFINLTRQALLDEVYSVLPPANSVVEILETIEPDRDVLAACKRVRSAGYTLALDDYVLDAKFEPLLRFIDVLKVEYPSINDEQRNQVLQQQRRFGFELLAEKVETYDQFKQAIRCGYRFFQGYFFCKPEMVQSRRLPASRLNHLRFLQAINDDATEVEEVESLIKREVSLSYKLLRYLNSAGFGLRSGVKSIRHAITLLGQRPLRKWASLVAVNEIREGKPVELMVTCLIRARFCELIAEAGLKQASATDMFTLGLFSLLDAMLDRPMSQIVNDLALCDELRNALTDDSSGLRSYLRLAIAMEQADWAAVSQIAQELSLNGNTINRAYREAIVWAEEITRELANAKSGQSDAKAA